MCGKTDELAEISLLAKSATDEPRMVLEHTKRICNECFMRFWNGDLEIPFIGKMKKGAS